eukprot:Gb_34376 [translate_table: standard]
MALLYPTLIFDGVYSFFSKGVCQYELNEMWSFASNIRWASLCGSQSPQAFLCSKPLWEIWRLVAGGPAKLSKKGSLVCLEPRRVTLRNPFSSTLGGADTPTWIISDGYKNGGEVSSTRRHPGMNVDPTDRDNHSGPRREDSLIDHEMNGWREPYLLLSGALVEPSRRGSKFRLLIVVVLIEKIIKEAIKEVPESIYDLEFSNALHFRPGRGCHSALIRIRKEWGTSRWFLEFGIIGCFHTIDRYQLILIFKEEIDDPKFFHPTQKLFFARRLVGGEKGGLSFLYGIIRLVPLETGRIDDQENSGEEASFNSPPVGDNKAIVVGGDLLRTICQRLTTQNCGYRRDHKRNPKTYHPLPIIWPEPRGRLYKINLHSCTKYGRIPRYGHSGSPFEGDSYIILTRAKEVSESKAPYPSHSFPPTLCHPFQVRGPREEYPDPTTDEGDERNRESTGHGSTSGDS